MFSALRLRQAATTTVRTTTVRQQQRRLIQTGLRGYPQYDLYGPDCYFSLKVMLPQYRITPANVLATEGRKSGSLLLEWTPRLEDGKRDPDRVLRFALSAEETGLVIDQLPDEPVELTRQPPMTTAEFGTIGGDRDNIPCKVCRIVPQEAGAVSFAIDYELHGQGGFSAAGEVDSGGPFEVVVQRGEFVVLRELMRTSIPALVTWDLKLDLAQQNRLQMAERGSVGGGAQDVPF